MRETKIKCDVCGAIITDAISSVELTIGGNGAAKNTYWLDDCCRSCYGEILNAIQGFMSRK